MLRRIPVLSAALLIPGAYQRVYVRRDKQKQRSRKYGENDPRGNYERRSGLDGVDDDRRRTQYCRKKPEAPRKGECLVPYLKPAS